MVFGVSITRCEHLSTLLILFLRSIRLSDFVGLGICADLRTLTKKKMKAINCIEYLDVAARYLSDLSSENDLRLERNRRIVCIFHIGAGHVLSKLLGTV